MLACQQNMTRELLEEYFSPSDALPLFVTPKLDGIRCRIVSEGGKLVGVSRKHLPIPNAQIQIWIEEHKHLVEGIDGELVVPGRSFHQTQSLLMTRNSVPFKWIYYIFDYAPEKLVNKQIGYLQRLQVFKNYHYKWQSNIKFFEPYECRSAQEVIKHEEQAVYHGFEGLILRSGDSPYKRGRATWKEGFMFKMKRFEDAEATIIGFVEKLTNENEKEHDEHGLSKRSKRKANLYPANTLGALQVRDCVSGIAFEIGSGWDHETAQEIWDNQENYLGEIVTYKHQPHGMKTKPRCPIWKGMRYD